MCIFSIVAQYMALKTTAVLDVEVSVGDVGDPAAGSVARLLVRRGLLLLRPVFDTSSQLLAWHSIQNFTGGFSNHVALLRDMEYERRQKKEINEIDLKNSDRFDRQP